MVIIHRNELRGKSASELQELFVATRRELLRLKGTVAEGSHRQVRQVRALRHQVARILTDLRAVQGVTAPPSKGVPPRPVSPAAL